MRNQKVARSDIYAGVKFVDAGVVHPMKRQREGWAYNALSAPRDPSGAPRDPSNAPRDPSIVPASRPSHIIPAMKICVVSDSHDRGEPRQPRCARRARAAPRS